MSYTVQQLAKLANISVRTLHFYDQEGLLKPSYVKSNGYRYYEQKELIQLQQILFLRELEFSLKDIKRILSSPQFNTLEALQDQKKMLTMKRDRLDKLIKSILNTIHSMKKKKPIKDDELYDAFKDDDVKEYQAEVKERWGNTDAYKQSQAKVSKMTKKEMDKLKADAKIFTQKLADAMDKPIDSKEVQELIAQHHKGIEFFYKCSYEMYRGLAQMYINDPRYGAYYEKFRPGLAQFVHDAIIYYCDQHKIK